MLQFIFETNKPIVKWLGQTRAKINKLTIKKSTNYKPTDGIKYLAYLEKMMKQTLLFNRGFDPELRPVRQIIIYETLILVFNAIGLIRKIFLIFVNEDSLYNNQLITYLGDSFYGHGNRTAIITIMFLSQIVGYIVKATVLWYELTDDLKIMNEFCLIKKIGFNGNALNLRTNYCQKFQRFSITLLGNMKLLMIGFSCFISSVQIFLVQSCWFLINDLVTKIFVIIWSIYIMSIMVWITSFGITFATLLLFSLSYVKCRQDSINCETRTLKRSEECPLDSIAQLIRGHNKAYNLLDLGQTLSSPITFFIFVPITLVADLGFYYGAIYGVEDGYINLLITTVSCILIVAFAIVTYLLGGVHAEAIEASKSIHKIIMRTPFNLRVNLKTLFLLERMLETPIAIRALDSVIIKQRVITYLLENASNIMLFTCNFAKSK